MHTELTESQSPGETGLVIYRAGTYDTVFEIPPNTFGEGESMSTIKEEVTLDNSLGVDYAFGITDVGGDGSKWLLLFCRDPMITSLPCGPPCF